MAQKYDEHILITRDDTGVPVHVHKTQWIHAREKHRPGQSDGLPANEADALKAVEITITDPDTVYETARPGSDTHHYERWSATDVGPTALKFTRAVVHHNVPGHPEASVVGTVLVSSTRYGKRSKKIVRKRKRRGTTRR